MNSDHIMISYFDIWTDVKVISLIVTCIFFYFRLMSVLLHAASTGKEMCKSESKPFCHKDFYSKLGGSCILRVHMQYPYGSLFKFVVTQASTRIRQKYNCNAFGS